MDRGVTSPGYVCSFLRLAYYLGTVLSAVLTIGCYCRERFTQPTGAYSTPLRSGSLSPTFFNEVVMVGIPSSVYLVLGLTSVLAIDIISSLKKDMAPPHPIVPRFKTRFCRVYFLWLSSAYFWVGFAALYACGFRQKTAQSVCVL